MLDALIRKSRSYRRFRQDERPSRETLRALVNLARLSPSAANRQPLKYLLSAAPERNAVIFPHLGWAGYLKDWSGPAPDERPTAYIVILGDTEVSKHFSVDHGIAAQSMMLGAVERGWGGCMIGSIDRPALREALEIPTRFEILLVLALGKPAEEVIVDSVDASGGIAYWRDKQDRHHVPKRSLDTLIVG